MRVRFSPGRAAGQVTMPASKSAAHRDLLAAALTPGVCEISPLPQNEDIQATVIASRRWEREFCVLRTARGRPCTAVPATSAKKMNSVPGRVPKTGERRHLPPERVRKTENRKK